MAQRILSSVGSVFLELDKGIANISNIKMYKNLIWNQFVLNNRQTKKQ